MSDTPTPTSSDADEHVIGDITFRRRKRDWDLTHELRPILTQLETVGRRSDHVRQKANRVLAKMGVADDGTPIDDDEFAKLDAEYAELDGQSDELQDQSDELYLQQLSVMLEGPDGERPSIDHLKKHLDYREFASLFASLEDRGQAADGQDPTPTADPEPSSPST